jgi:glycolate oxidase FAD binding subunit
MLAPNGLMCAADPPSPDLATIGGVLAAATQGPLRHGYGSVRDFCIGVRFVTGDGRIGKGGGRVVKNVAGYDMMKLLIGSFGSLAVITSASFKLFPTPRQTRTFLAEFATWQEAVAFRDVVMKSPLSPICLELVSPGARRRMRPNVTEDAWVICVRAAGSDAVLARYRRELGSAATREVGGDDETALWRALAHFPIPPEEERDYPLLLRLRAGYPLSIFAPPSELGPVLQVLERHANPEVVTLDYIGRVGMGHLLVAYHMVDMEVVEQSFISALRQQMPKSVQFVGGNAPLSDSMRAIKRALDPNNVFRGRFVF